MLLNIFQGPCNLLGPPETFRAPPPPPTPDYHGDHPNLLPPCHTPDCHGDHLNILPFAPLLIIVVTIGRSDVHSALWSPRQHQDRTGWNSSLEHRFHALEESYMEATALLQVHGSLIYDMQRQVHNLSMVVERVRRNPGCMINIIRTSPLLSNHEMLHPGQCSEHSVAQQPRDAAPRSVLRTLCRSATTRCCTQFSAQNTLPLINNSNYICGKRDEWPTYIYQLHGLWVSRH